MMIKVKISKRNQQVVANWIGTIVLSIIIGIWIGSVLGEKVTLERMKERTYPLTTVVVETREKTNEVVCLDFNGNEWIFVGIEDWFVGDFATLTMNTKGTEESVYDDEVIQARYSGWLNGSWGYDFETKGSIITIDR